MPRVCTVALTALFAASTLLSNATNAAAMQGQTGSGTLTAKFISPTPSTCVPSIPPQIGLPRCDGIGTDSISWGDPGDVGIGQSSLWFAPNAFANLAVGQTFVMGLLTFYNGTIFTGSGIDDVLLQIVSTSTVPAFNQTLNLPLRFGQTINAGLDPFADADFLFFSDALQFGSFRVFEGASATVEILGRFNSLDNEGFGRISNESVPGAGFLNPSVSVVPEPTTLGLCALGLIGMFGTNRWRTTRRKA